VKELDLRFLCMSLGTCDRKLQSAFRKSASESRKTSLSSFLYPSNRSECHRAIIPQFIAHPSRRFYRKIKSKLIFASPTISGTLCNYLRTDKGARINYCAIVRIIIYVLINQTLIRSFIAPGPAEGVITIAVLFRN
jgi:hypothetical protein